MPRNRLLAALPRAEYRLLVPGLERILLRQNQTLYKCDEPIWHAYFPEQCVISLLSTLSDGSSIEVAVVGNSGFLGISLALGGQTSAHFARVQVGGDAIRMRAQDFLSAFQRGGKFHNLVLNYIRCRVFMMAQSVICNRRHALHQRLARLLLTVDDQSGSSQFPMTHEFMSQILGSARSEIAKAAAHFRASGLIEYHRGQVEIVNRTALESAVCECYWTVKQEFNKYLPEKKSPASVRGAPVIRIRAVPHR